MRRKSSDSSRDRAFTSSVFPSPGRPSSRTCPCASSAATTSSIISSLPRITRRSCMHEFRDIGLRGGDGFGRQEGLGLWLHVRDPFSGWNISAIRNFRSIVSRHCSGEARASGAQPPARQFRKTAFLWKPGFAPRFFRSAGKDRDGRPVVRAPHRTGRQSGRLEAIEGKGLVTPCQVRIAAAAVDATATGLPVVLGCSS